MSENKNIIEEMQPFVNLIGETWGDIQWHIDNENASRRRKQREMTPNKYLLLKKRSKDLSKRLKDLSWRNNTVNNFQEHIELSALRLKDFRFPTWEELNRARIKNI
jgi:hypothetical protein